MAAVKAMFDHKHYVPILRCRKAELMALRLLPPEDKRKITPLIELSPNLLAFKRRKNLINRDLFLEVTKQIVINWGQSPLFIDFELIEALFTSPKGKHPISFLAESARTIRLPIIPVTGLRPSLNYGAALGSVVTADRRGICVRLRQEDLRNPSLGEELRQLMAKLKLTPKQVDILVDLKLIGQVSMKLTEICARIPTLSSWRTFTLAGGAFPVDLRDIKKNSQHEQSRDDWLYWFKQVKEGPVLPRRPTFSDYTIQHPVYPEQRTERPNPSASIRYTSDIYWVIMRGQALYGEGGPGHDQYWANARLLSKRKEFCGAGFSKGDEYISEIGQQTKKKGTPQTWLQAGINHHIAFVIRQLANSFGSSTDGVPGSGSGLGPPPPQVSRRSSREASSAGLQPYQVPLIK